MLKKRLRLEMLESRRVLATLTVTSLEDTVADDGQLTLREAILAANTDSVVDGVQGSGADVIEFDPALFEEGPAEIQLEDIAATEYYGSTHLLIESELTILGPGAELLSIVAADDTTAIEITSGPVQIEELSFTRSTLPESYSTAFGVMSTASVTLADVAFSNHGGAVQAREGALQITDGIFEGNIVGVAIGNNVDAEVADSRFEGNDLGLNVTYKLYPFFEEAASFASSLAVSTHSSPLVLVADSVFTNNASGLHAAGAHVRVQRTDFYENGLGHGIGVQEWGWGAAVKLGRWEGTMVEVLDSTFRDNASYIGGAIYAQPYTQLVVHGSSFEENVAERQGGAITVHEYADAVISESQFLGNLAGFGGAVANYGVNFDGALRIQDSLFSDNEAQYGGALYTFVTTEIIGSTFVGNSAESGGAMSLVGDVLIFQSTVTGNSATDPLGESEASDLYPRAGGIDYSIIDQFELRIHETTIVSNSTDSSAGGGLYLSHSFGTEPWQDGVINVEIKNSVIADNTAGGEHADLLRGNTWRLTAEEADLANDPPDLYYDAFLDVTLSHSLISASGSQFRTVIRSEDLGEIDTDITAPTNALPEAPLGAPDENGNLIGGEMYGAINPRLAPLGDYGGPTPTHVPYSDSPVIDAGLGEPIIGNDDLYLPRDQRGDPYLRLYGEAQDIGSTEWLPEGLLPGDYNTDGRVDAADYSIWRDGNHSTNGDFDAIDLLDPEHPALIDYDYLVWALNYGASEEDLGEYPVEPSTLQQEEFVRTEETPSERRAFVPAIKHSMATGRRVSAEPSRPVRNLPDRSDLLLIEDSDVAKEALESEPALTPRRGRQDTDASDEVFSAVGRGLRTRRR